MLSLMAQEFYAQSPVLMFPIAALLLFVFAFTLLTVRALRKPRKLIDELARMPLEDELDIDESGATS